jgi:hypothetical protein
MTIKHVQPLAKINLIFALLQILLALFFYFKGTAAGLVLILIALPFLVRKGIEINSEKKQFREIKSLFGVTIGKWKNLPTIEYVSVFKTIKNNRLRARTAETTHGFTVYKVNLFYKQNQHLEVYITEDKNEAFKLADHFSKSFEIEIFDASEN